MKKFLFAILTASCACGAWASEPAAEPAATSEKFSYMPQIHGVVRARWENDLDAGLSRFQLRNTRLTVSGNIAPSIDYFLQADLCDRGSMKFLDGYARIRIVKGLSFQAGQFRMPFGIDMFRAPANYIFSNRSFMGKQVCNVRAVGAKATYAIPSTPLTLEAGLFNPTSIYDQLGYYKTYAYAGRAILNLPAGFSMQAGYMSLAPDQVRMNMVDAGITWNSTHWTVEAEYLHEHYTKDAHKATHAYNFWTSYRFPVNAGVFNQLAFQGRFDGMTAHSSGVRNSDGLLISNDPARNRVTVGATLSFIQKPVWLDVRVDYEKFFYHKGVVAPVGDGDRLVAELVLRF
ncbi:MAG: OprO/OprP family phosphate-selective porin [Muribaculaceae bacterium]|nr:OprO/OprP family phosphate-selective porin [Muribaculaceae bacterium]